MTSGAFIEEYSMLVASRPKKLGAVTAMVYEAVFFSLSAHGDTCGMDML